MDSVVSWMLREDNIYLVLAWCFRKNKQYYFLTEDVSSFERRNVKFLRSDPCPFVRHWLNQLVSCVGFCSCCAHLSACRATLGGRDDVAPDVEPSTQQQWRTPRRKLFRAAGKITFLTLCHWRGVVSTIVIRTLRAKDTKRRHFWTICGLQVLKNLPPGCWCGAIRCSSAAPFPARLLAC